MSPQKTIPTPGAARIMLALLVVVPAMMTYPLGLWGHQRGYWALGIAVLALILLFGWWRGLYFTTIARRRLAMLRRRRSTSAPGSPPSCATYATMLLRVGPSVVGPQILPLSLIARYLHCYGIRADSIRIISRTQETTETWIGLTVSAVTNLAALQARSSQIPLQETTQVAARRLADHLREVGWEISAVDAGEIPEIPPVFTPGYREIWPGVVEDESNYLAAYQVNVDESLAEVLAEIRSYPASAVWLVLEIAGDSDHYTIAVACAFRTDAKPATAAPLPGLTPQHGNHVPALRKLNPLSTRRLDGHVGVSAELVQQLGWPVSLVETASHA